MYYGIEKVGWRDEMIETDEMTRVESETGIWGMGTGEMFHSKQFSLCPPQPPGVVTQRNH